MSNIIIVSFPSCQYYSSAVRKPVIESLERVSPTGVRVEWSQPPGGAAVTGYVVFYYDGSVTRNKSIPSTSTEITVSSATLIYVISVMALSEEPFLLKGVHGRLSHCVSVRMNTHNKRLHNHSTCTFLYIATNTNTIG